MSEITSSAAAQLAHEQERGSKTVFGFWVYLMTDCILFASLFATYAVLRNNTFGGPSGRELFDLPFVLVETLLLLTSSFTCGLAVLAAHRGHKRWVLNLFAVTFLLGLAFLTMEITEFRHLAAEGHGWTVNAFMSAFYTLVGTHGAHIASGLLWMIVLLPRVVRQGLTVANKRRLTLLSMFWHFLDIIWIFIFTIVYLMGAL